MKIYGQDTGMEFGIENVLMRSGKRKRQIVEGTEQPNQERIRTHGEKQTYKYL